MSERTRAKEALRVEVNTYTGENVRKIAATSAITQEDRILRVAAYCRVSTDDIDQLVSIELQKNNYRDMIKANPKWKYVGTYVDDGFSGTNTEHRPAFQLMMKDAILNSRNFGHTGGYLPMRVIDHGALTGYISINRAWAGYDADEYFRVCNIAMGLMDGELEVDLETEYLSDGGHRLPGLTEDGGIQRIARVLTKAEEAVKAQLEGTAPSEEQQEATPQIRIGFQIVSGSMFSHAFDPYVKFTPEGFSFTSTCISRLMRSGMREGGVEMQRQLYVEVLLNPVERMLAVRPCAPDHPNAIRWTTDRGKSRWLGGKAFCSILYEILEWDAAYSYRAPATVRTRNNETILFFDLDNYVGVPIRKKQDLEGTDADQDAPVQEVIRHEDTRGIFYGAEDDEPQEVVDTEDMERRLQELAEYERRHFGTPAFEHDGDVRLPAIDDEGEWDVMAEARVLGDDHRVDESIVEAMQEQMLEAMIAAEDAAVSSGAVSDSNAHDDGEKGGRT